MIGMNGETPLQQYVMYATLLDMVSEGATESERAFLERRAREQQAVVPRISLVQRLRAWAASAGYDRSGPMRPATRRA